MAIIADVISPAPTIATRRSCIAAQHSRASLIRDEGGAIMVVGLFMSVFLVGALYALAGVGATVAYQERMQQAADEAAFSAAVGHATSMNAIATVNAASSVSLAVLAGATLTESAADLCVRFGIITGEGNPRSEYPAPDGFCRQLLDRYSGARAEMQPQLVEELRRGTDAADAVARETPRLAADEVESVLRSRLGRDLRHGFFVRRPMAAVPSGTAAFCALANLHTHRLAEIAMGLDMAYRIIGEDNAHIGRDLPYCPEVDGVDAYVPAPANRPVGTEPYQVRVIAIGDSPRLRVLEQGVNVARIFSTQWVDVGRGSPSDMGTVASVVVAQAEYYSTWHLANSGDDLAEHSVEEEAFRTEWRARLRRWRFPTGGSADPAIADPLYEEWLRSTVLPECGGACADVVDDLWAARDALH
ncbi:hypothetical protein [Sandaracinus amylolyticus]|nr:hypothetical protein [Sandaracinus amylolyticus]